MRPYLSLSVRSVLAAMLAVIGSAICVDVDAAQQPAPAELQVCHGDYTIGPEDVLDIAVWNNAEMTHTVPVRPDGKISLPLLNDVQAAGLSPMELREVLAKSLTAYIASPIVSVIVREIHSFKVTVIGEVKAVGRYELKSRATVVDALALAGGPTEYAERGKIVVLRERGGSTLQIPFALEKLGTKSAASSKASSQRSPANFCLMPGDIVLVP
jgi:polysaccharide export outer membrane protein